MKTNQDTMTRYCETHEMHWIPSEGISEKASSCPWCQRDRLFDELEMIRDIFFAAVESKESKGGQHVQYHGDFCSMPPSCTVQMRWWIRRWDEVLGKK